jgi:phenylalanyl-tRNA synthetase alpha chain
VSSDFYDLVRSVGGDSVERVALIDVFSNEKTRRTSHCYTIAYQHPERDIAQDEVTQIHEQIARLATEQLGVTIR